MNKGPLFLSPAQRQEKIEALRISQMPQDKAEADRLILEGYACGLCGYELPTAVMLFEGKGFYSQQPLGFTHRKRAVEILMQLPDAMPDKFYLLGKYLLYATVFCQDTPTTQPPEWERLNDMPQEAIAFLQKDGRPKAFALLGSYYYDKKAYSQAYEYYLCAYRSSLGKEYGDRVKACREALGEAGTPQERLAFLFPSADAQEQKKQVQRAYWEVTHPGYVQAMERSLQEGYHDPDALRWQELMLFREDIIAWHRALVQQEPNTN